ncbi:MAG: galactokinase [Oscillospiraceae bacterium]|nr:galactokinase [Oscillospiraceae bacterium]
MIALQTAIETGAADDWLAALYIERERCISLCADFTKHFGAWPEKLFSVPGRTELGGNHTDHQHGRVLCAAITRDTLAAVRRRQDGVIRVVSRGVGEAEISLARLAPRPEERHTMAALLRGVAGALAERGYTLGGFDAYLTSNVPIGSGFSSSAAFSVLLGAVMNELYNGGAASPLTIAKAAQQAERDWYGKPCGLMDQCACALGGVSLLDFLDPTDPAAESLPFDFSEHGFVLAAVKLPDDHADLTADYAAIPADMRAAAKSCGAEVLRYVNREKWENTAATLAERVRERAEHFFEENERVPQMAAALRSADMEGYRQLMLASGRSSRHKLKNIVPPSKPEARLLEEGLDLAETLLGERGAWRVHGGGFGGSLLALMPAADWPAFQTAMDARFGIGAAQKLQLRRQGIACWPEK